VPMEFSKHSLRTRRKADIAYGRAVAAKVAAFGPEVVVSSNMPLDAQNILQQAAKRQNARFVFWLQDVYSSAVRFVLKRKLGPLAGLAAAHYERLEKRLLRDSNAVVCIAPGFARIATDWGVDPARIRSSKTGHRSTRFARKLRTTNGRANTASSATSAFSTAVRWA